MNVISVLTHDFNTISHFATIDKEQFIILTKFLSYELCGNYNQLIYALRNSISCNLQINANGDYHMLRIIDELDNIGFDYTKWIIVENKHKTYSDEFTYRRDPIHRLHKMPKHVNGLIINKHYVIKF